jgi:hypothetical protein
VSSSRVRLDQRFIGERTFLYELCGYRLQTSRKVVQFQAATKIQAAVRGKQAKEYVARSRKRLERQRQVRRVEKRQKAALKIQCRARVYLARRKARRKREIKEEEERERREFEDLELSLEGLHEDFMNELLVIRAQKGARSMLAKKYVFLYLCVALSPVLTICCVLLTQQLHQARCRGEGEQRETNRKRQVQRCQAHPGRDPRRGRPGALQEEPPAAASRSKDP